MSLTGVDARIKIDLSFVKLMSLQRNELYSTSYYRHYIKLKLQYNFMHIYIYKFRYTCKLSHFSCVPVFVTLWIIAH